MLALSRVEGCSSSDAEELTRSWQTESPCIEVVLVHEATRIHELPCYQVLARQLAFTDIVEAQRRRPGSARHILDFVGSFGALDHCHASKAEEEVRITTW